MDTAKLRRKRVVIPAVTAAALGIGGAAWASTTGPGLPSGGLDRLASAATQAAGGGTVTGMETDDDLGRSYEVEVRRPDGTEVDVTVDRDLKVLRQDTDVRRDDDDADERPLGSSERASAARAALAAVGGGTVTDVEADGDGAEAYEVEVRTSDGTEWDVDLDARFRVLEKSVDD